jgi:glycosyltransferase involved in cell wall biosynthesis
VTLSVVVITFNEEANLPRTLESVKWADEIVVVDSGSTDKTVEVAKMYGAKVWVETWKGFAAQKNSAIEKATCDWVLSIDADEVVTSDLKQAIQHAIAIPANNLSGYWIPRMNYIFGRWMRHGGYWPDRKLRLFRRGKGRLELRPVHETIQVDGSVGHLSEPLFHEAYPTLTGYIEHMNRYSSLGAEVATSKGATSFSVAKILLRPVFTFIYNYFFRLGLLDGREGLLLHLYHSVYVSWKYAKAWEQSRKSAPPTNQLPR